MEASLLRSHRFHNTISYVFECYTEGVSSHQLRLPMEPVRYVDRYEISTVVSDRNVLSCQMQFPIPGRGVKWVVSRKTLLAIVCRISIYMLNFRVTIKQIYQAST